MKIVAMLLWTIIASAMVPPKSFCSKYFNRLGLDPLALDPNPTIAKLRILQEAHLERIPFENLSQHGCPQPAVLNITAIAEKILNRRRGGFCFELNGLLAVFLEELGYKVCRVPAFVFAEGGFRDQATHLVLIVTCSSNKEWYVDVGFGEPAIHPLLHSSLDTIQHTPEGMKNRLVEQNKDIVYEWYRDNQWSPRLKWNFEATRCSPGLSLSDFSVALGQVLDDSSIFAQKIIVCRLTRATKWTLAGNRVKRTGPPRFGKVPIEPTIEVVDSEHAARELLEHDFGIPLAESVGLTFAKSLQADPALWSNQ